MAVLLGWVGQCSMGEDISNDGDLFGMQYESMKCV